MNRFLVAAFAVATIWGGGAHAELSVDRMIVDLGLKEGDTPVRALPGWKPPKKIVIGVDTPQRLAWLQEVAPGVTLVSAASPDTALALVKDADAVAGFCSAAIVKAAVKARWIQAGTAGVEGCASAPELKSGRIVLTNMQKVYGPGIAEHVMAMMLSLTRGITSFTRA